ncbi:MAG TPA: tripartite tricarboxylate transporter substrate binding protein [Xanthobacteraceae bacterium]|nr:tripartite tricarboxylate transporter substrate binding protein [Xanthobacteraceae bacterium]
MEMTRRDWLGGAVSAAGLALGAPSAFGQTTPVYPAKDIKAVCTFQPGSRQDVFVRFFAERFGAIAGRNMQVDSRAGKDGNAGTQFVAKAKPDGYTLLIAPGNETLAVAAVSSKKPGFDPAKDFVPVTALLRTSYAILVNAKSSQKTLADLTAALKAKAGKGTYGVNTNTTLIAAEHYNKLSGAGASRIRYKDYPSLLNDLVSSGTTDFIVMDVPRAADQVKNGTLRALAVTGGQRSSALPQVPTVEEAGLKGYGKIDQWWGVFAPVATPQAVLDKLETIFNRVAASDEAKAFLANGGADPFPGSSTALKELLASENKRWAELAEQAGVQRE